MTRAYNFCAGPAALPESVLKQASEEMLDYQGRGLSVMEMSHRSKEMVAIAEKAEQDLRELLGISDDYHVLFLQGGASQPGAAVLPGANIYPSCAVYPFSASKQCPSPTCPNVARVSSSILYCVSVKAVSSSASVVVSVSPLASAASGSKPRAP